ncbi:YciI family protein [Modestobacter versicolor]|uniref:YciI family protein n=1 Tax=Modestobacter versicolor TaxID=429133 RepID=UPI0034DF6372
MPQYLFMLYDREDLYAEGGEELFETTMQAHRVFTAAVEAADGARVLGGEALRDQATATTVRRDPAGEPLVTDGPFLEAKEAFGGYYLIEARDLDQALDLAKQCPVLAGGVEVRPVWDMGEEG